MWVLGIVFILELGAGTGGLLSSWEMSVTITDLMLVPLALFAGFRYMPEERRKYIYTTIVVVSGSLGIVRPPRSLMSTTAIVAVSIAVICIGIFWSRRNNTSTE